MKQIKVGVNQLKQQSYNAQLELKKNIFEDVLKYCTQYVIIIDFQRFANDMSNEFKRLFLIAYEDEFASLLSYEKMCEMSDISLSKIEAYQKQYEGIDIDLNPVTMKALKEPDFSIYISDEEQIKKYNRSKFLLQKLKEIEAHGIEVKPVAIQKAFSGMLQYNWMTNELTPNYV